ncbi:hypothetical protein QBC40DRAFT_11871 [Triangularia verruculosa]|uniref:Uncharacterized protein n=1 Tax=Triangularia verruculosa TaxID=2587418 RepID=A0AAN6X8I2_9PEZI|nr:hypothetical protein QBC40DRAFT_11871 [Triangularia verruculosa]
MSDGTGESQNSGPPEPQTHKVRESERPMRLAQSIFQAGSAQNTPGYDDSDMESLGSFESGVLSLSSESDDDVKKSYFNQASVGFEIVMRVKDRLLERYRILQSLSHSRNHLTSLDEPWGVTSVSGMTRARGTEGSSGTQTMTQTNVHNEQEMKAHSTSRKRRRNDSDQDDDPEESGEDRKGKRPDRAPKEGPSRDQKLACHFWKLNPKEHRRCFRMNLQDVSRIKQHLNRNHYNSHCNIGIWTWTISTSVLGPEHSPL